MDKPRELLMGCATITDLVVELVKMNIFMVAIAKHKLWQKKEKEFETEVKKRNKKRQEAKK